MSRIESVRAFEILDSRGNPTLQVNLRTNDGFRGWAQVPSGASTGRHEAHEFRDGDASRYQGKGVHGAIDQVNRVIASALWGMEVSDRDLIDRRMIELDQTPNKRKIGANAILGVSCAVARAAAAADSVDLWELLAGPRPATLPLPMVNILSGGHHAGHNFEFQDFLAVPHGFSTLAEALAATAAVRIAAREALEARGQTVRGVADEGGWGPLLASNEEALQVMVEAIERAGYRPGEHVSIAIDVAATHFYEGGSYELRSENRRLASGELIDLLERWCGAYPIVSIEDGVAEDDWAGMRELTQRLGSTVQIIGDDFFTTNSARFLKGVGEQACNSILVKMNQIGTLLETFEVIDLAVGSNYTAVISARSGDTEDPFLADLAVASGAGQIKVGSLARSERLAKYNRLLELESEGRLAYSAASALQRFLK